MARPRIYTVHINPSLPHPHEAAEFVQEGFSWKAFFFPLLFALYHRLWWKSALLFVYHCLIFLMLDSGTLSNPGLSIINLGIHLLIGFEANDWVRKRLTHKGYLLSDLTTGDSPLRAELRFFDRYFTPRPLAG